MVIKLSAREDNCNAVGVAAAAGRKIASIVSHVCQHAPPVVRIKTCASATGKQRYRPLRW